MADTFITIGVVLVFIGCIGIAILGMFESAGADTCWHNDDPRTCDLCHREMGRR